VQRLLARARCGDGESSIHTIQGGEDPSSLLAIQEMGSGGGGRNGAVARRYIRSKEPRMRWSADLHRSFLQAIDCLGGQHSTFSFLRRPLHPLIM
jgi:hypothetical protein